MRPDRRDFLTRLAGMGALPLLGGLAGCQQTPARSTSGQAQPASALSTAKLTDRISVVSGAPGNVVVLSANDGLVLVDGGSAALAKSVRATLGNAPVRTLINTHYHADQTGGNALFGAAGASIHAHEITREWLATDYYVPADDHWVKALPAVAVPKETFRDKSEMRSGAESIECGYLLEAHTRGDIYVFFRDSNVLAVGDAASPLRDPALDWYAGGWIGGRVDSMEKLLKLANDDTRIVPAYGPVMSRAELQTEQAMMKHLYDRTTDMTDHGRSAKDMLDEGVMTEIERKFQDPYRFLYDVSKGNWAHYTNFGGNIV
jgi:cyclase